MAEETLSEYKEKRNFQKTTEPKPEIDTTRQNRFVIQEHHASHLHWDFRLEMDGVLKSWAVPKGVPDRPGIKRLAVQTEDHPVSYIDFEGEIPEGEYGAGTVSIWDKGTFQLLRRDEKVIEVGLSGIRLSGIYILVYTNKKQWLIFRKKD